MTENNIIVNYQASPDEEGFTAAGSLRMGVQEMTRFGMAPSHFQELAQLIFDAIVKDRPVKEKVAEFRKNFLDMKYCFSGSQYEDAINKLHKLV